MGVGRNLETNPLSESECLMIFGEMLSPHEVVARLNTQPLTPEQANALFIADVERAEEGCYRLVGMELLNSPRRACLINMAFQMGLEGLMKFENTIRFAESGDYEQCANEMLDSKWARKDTPARAAEIAMQMRTGEWQ